LVVRPPKTQCKFALPFHLSPVPHTLVFYHDRKPYTPHKKKLIYFTQLLFSENVKKNAQQAIPFWIASLVVGFVAVGYTKLFGFAEGWLQKLLARHAWTIFIATPICFVTAWYIVQKLAPNARGSGIPQVMAAIDLATPKHDNKIGHLLGLRIGVTKILSSMVMVLGGGAVLPI